MDELNSPLDIKLKDLEGLELEDFEEVCYFIYDCTLQYSSCTYFITVIIYILQYSSYSFEDQLVYILRLQFMYMLQTQ